MPNPQTTSKRPTPDADIKAATEAEASTLTNAEIAKKVGGEVLDMVAPKKDEPAEPAMVPIRAEHILSHRIDGEDLHVVTIDGKKHKVAA